MIAGLAVACLSARGSAQEVEPWSPRAPTIGLGYYGVTGDGESSRRIGLTWYRSAQQQLLVTARFWGVYDAAEAEYRFSSRRPRSFRPYFAVSGVWQRHVGQRSVGGTIGGGVEFYPLEHFVATGALAWQSLFGLRGASGNHWFRLTVGVSVVPFG